MYIQLLGGFLLTTLAPFIFFDRYARRIEPKLNKFPSDQSRLLSVVYSYIVWYPAIGYLVLGVWASENRISGFYFGLAQCSFFFLWSLVGFAYFEMKRAS